MWESHNIDLLILNVGATWGVSGQLHTAVALAHLYTEEKPGWAPALGWTLSVMGT